MNKVDFVPEFLAQGLKARLGSSEVDLFGLFHQRADPIGAFALRDHAADCVLNLFKSRQGNSSGIDWLAARRLFAQFGNIHVAEKGQDERAWNWRRGENEHVHRFALLCQRQPLVNAKAMLFVDHGEREVMEGNVFLEKRVGADQKVDIAKHKSVQDLFASRPAFAPG